MGSLSFPIYFSISGSIATKEKSRMTDITVAIANLYNSLGTRRDYSLKMKLRRMYKDVPIVAKTIMIPTKIMRLGPAGRAGTAAP